MLSIEACCRLRIEKKLKPSQCRIDTSVIDAIDWRSGSLERGWVISSTSNSAGSSQLHPSYRLTVVASASIIEAVTVAFKRLCQSLERGYDSTGQLLMHVQKQLVVCAIAPQVPIFSAALAPLPTSDTSPTPTSTCRGDSKLMSVQRQCAGNYLAETKEAELGMKAVEDLLINLSQRCAPESSPTAISRSVVKLPKL